MNSLDRALGAFGETIGLDRLALGPGGNLALQLDSGRRVAIEAADTEVLVYVSDPVPYDAAQQAARCTERAGVPSQRNGAGRCHARRPGTAAVDRGSKQGRQLADPGRARRMMPITPAPPIDWNRVFLTLRGEGYSLYDHQREGGQRESQRAQHHGGKALEADLHDDEVQAPDHHHRQGAEIIFLGKLGSGGHPALSHRPPP